MTLLIDYSALSYDLVDKLSNNLPGLERFALDTYGLLTRNFGTLSLYV